MIFGSSIRTEACKTHGKDSQKFTLLAEKPPKGFLWSGGETDKNSNDYQTLQVVACEVWSRMRKAAQKKE